MAEFIIQCAVVLYKQRPGESEALSALIDICNSEIELASQIAILVQDNSPIDHIGDMKDLNASQHVSLDYIHVPENPGLACAYNTALELATKRDIPWLLLLDQDTCLTRQFFGELLTAIQGQESQSYCAFVPQLVRDNLVLSPQAVGKLFYRRIPIGFSGLSPRPLIAFNSAACIRVQDLAAIGGFPEEFWLDYLDHIVFHRLQETRKGVFILDAQLRHNLSLQNIESEVSIERYNNILTAEWMFVRITGWGGGAFVHRLRLLKRALSHSIKLRNKSYAMQTLRSALS